MKNRDEYTEAAVRMSDAIASLLSAQASGWIAVDLADGTHDGMVYREREEAEADQTGPCAYVRIPALRKGRMLDCPVAVSECADYLRFTAVLRRLAPGHTPVLLGRGGGLIGLPDAPWGAEYRKVYRQPWKQALRSAVASTEMFRDLVLHLPGAGDRRMAYTDGRRIHLSIREPNPFPCEVTYTPTGRVAAGYSTGS